MAWNLEIPDYVDPYGDKNVDENKVNKNKIKLDEAIAQIVTKITAPANKYALGVTLHQIYRFKTDIDKDQIVKDEIDKDEIDKDDTLDYPHTEKTKKGFASYWNEQTEQILPCKFEFYVSNGNFIKLYVYDDNNFSNVIESKILSEIYFQQKASVVSLQQLCLFTPFYISTADPCGRRLLM